MNKDQIAVLITMDQINQGHFLLGRYNQDNDHLTEITVVDEARKVPPPTDLIRYDLLLDGAPLNEFVKANCEGWDGSSRIRLYFNVANGSFITWDQSATSTAGANTG